MASREVIEARVRALPLPGASVITRGDRCVISFEEDGVSTEIEFPIDDDGVWATAERNLHKRGKPGT